MRNIVFKLMLSVGMCLLSCRSVAEHVVIVHPENMATVLREHVEKLYLAKSKTFSDGSSAVPFNHKDSSTARILFDSEIVGKSESQIKSYWAKLLFTGKAVPIKQVESDREMIDAVASNPHAIGYISAANVNESVKIVLSF